MLLAGLWIASIVGAALTLGSLVSRLMDVGFRPNDLGWKVAAIYGICLTGWALIGWTSRPGPHRNHAPPSWVILAIVGLVWAALLVNRVG